MTRPLLCKVHGIATTYNHSAVEEYLDFALYCTECLDYPENVGRLEA